MPVEYPFIRITDRGERFPGLRWQWRLIMTPEQAQKDHSYPYGIAMTRWGARYSARRAYKEQLRKQEAEGLFEDVRL
jgi:hypothetical protein